MKATRLIFFAILLTQVACLNDWRSGSCQTQSDVDGNFDLEVEDRGSFLLIYLRNTSKEDIGITELPEPPYIMSSWKSRRNSIICLGEEPGAAPFVRVRAGEAIEFQLEKEKVKEEIGRLKSSEDFRFLYNGLQGSYSGVCSMNADAKIECR